MRTAAICPTCATYENAVCVIYDGPTLSNISVPPSTNLQVALGNIDSTVEDLQSQIDYLSTNPINLTTLGSSGPAEFDGNVLNIPIYAPTLQEVLTNGNTGETWINLDGSNSDVAFSAYTTSSQVTLLADANGYPYLNITDNATKSTDIFKDSIRFTNITDTYSISLVSPNTLTATQNIDIPDASGTMALTSDITLQNATSGTNKNLTDGINLQGTGAGDNNTGTQDINALGLDAAKNNSGAIVNALGRRAAQGNTGANVNAFGIDSANGNTGSIVNSIGSACLTNNSGSYVNAIGGSSGANNTFSYINLFGFGATASANNQVVFSKDIGSQMARIGYGGITADRLYTLPDATGTLALTNTVWSLSGNASTNPSTNFIGTTDDQDLVFKRNSIEYLRFKTTGANDDVYFSKNIKLQATTPQIWLNGSSGYSVISTDSTGGFIQLNNNNSHSATIKAANLTTDKTLQLPNANGNLAVSVNGQTADANGNITLSAGGGNTTTVKVSLTSAQLLAISVGNPVILVTAASGKIVVPISGFLIYKGGTTSYTSGTIYTAISTTLGSSSLSTVNLLSFGTTNTLIRQTFGFASISAAGIDVPTGNQIFLTSSGISGGDGTLDYYLTYFEI